MVINKSTIHHSCNSYIRERSKHTGVSENKENQVKYWMIPLL